MRRAALLLAILLGGAGPWQPRVFQPSSTPTHSITFSTLANGSPSSTVAGSGTYTGTAPSSISSAAWNSPCSGSSTITGFSAGGGTFSLTASTPSAGCVGTLTITDNLGDSATSPTVTIGTGYVGPGDLAARQGWYGLRAYSAAVAAPGTNTAVSLIRVADSHTCDILIATTGHVGNTVNCSTGGDNGQSAAAWQGIDATGTGAITGNTLTFVGGHQFDVVTGASLPPDLYIFSGSSPTWTLNKALASPVSAETMTLYNPVRITVWYDQANIGGTQHNATQATTANQAFYNPVCFNSGADPCAILGGGDPATFGSKTFYTVSAAPGFFSSTPTNDAFVLWNTAASGSPGAYVAVKDVTNTWDFALSQTNASSHDFGLNAITTGLNTLAGDVMTLNACHGVGGSYDGSNMRLYHDGTQDSHSPQALTGSLRGAGSNYNIGSYDGTSTSDSLYGLLMEFGMGAGADSGATQASIYANQTAFWGC